MQGGLETRMASQVTFAVTEGCWLACGLGRGRVGTLAFSLEVGYRGVGPPRTLAWPWVADGSLFTHLRAAGPVGFGQEFGSGHAEFKTPGGIEGHAHRVPGGQKAVSGGG